MPKPLRVLIVEDQENDEKLLVLELQRLGYEITSERVDTREAMVAALEDRLWDVVISDFRMPHFSAPEALEVLRRQELEIPFIIVSGSIGEEEAVDSMRLGASDFVVKGRLTRLGPAIERGLREFEERRTLRATEARLRQSQKMEAIGQLAGGVAHDFNNLLGVIQGYADLLLRDLPRGERASDRVEKMMGAVNRAATLTRQLLTFSRQQSLEAKPVDLNAVVAEIETMCRRVIGEDIQIVTVLADDLNIVKVDPSQVGQVLMNLVINARDAISGGGRIIIETSNVDLDEVHSRSHPGLRAGPYVMLAVSDTGVGMDATTLSHIFEPFFTTKEPGRGTGLGLSTVYGIVRQSGGHIAVYSEPGRGTTFKVYLPLAEGGEEPMDISRRSADLVPQGTETVVLIEDEETLRDVIHDLLVQGGYSVIDGPTPEESLAAAERFVGRINLVITDLIMPRVSGREAAARVHASQPGVKVLYISGYTGAAAETHGPLDGRHAFLQKPFGLETLLRKVREVLDSPPDAGLP